MDFNEYQDKALKTAQYPAVGSNMVYPALKLAGEAGELADKIGKHWRNFNAKYSNGNDISVGIQAGTLSPDQRTKIILELGDILWYVSAISQEIGVTLDYIAIENINKLTGRAERGTILSEGDIR